MDGDLPASSNSSSSDWVVTEHAEKALPITDVLVIKGVLQGTLLLCIGAALLSMTYLYVNRRLRARIYGPLATGVTQLMMFVVSVALVLVLAMQIVAISKSDVPCALHSVVSTALVPICGTVLLLRGWVLAVQFARVHEQLRWLKLYQMSPKDRAVAEQRPMPFGARVDLWISSHRAVSSPSLLIAIAVAFSVLIWTPSIVIEVGNRCEHDKQNDWNDTNVWLFCVLALMLSTKLRGKIDRIGVRRELLISAIVIVVGQLLQMLVELVEAQVEFDPTIDADALEDEFSVEVSFAMWYVHAWASLELLLLVVLVTVRPAVKLFRRRHGFGKAKSAQQKLNQILNDRHLKEDFHDFLQREFSVENLTFFDSVKTLVKKSVSVLASPTDDSIKTLESRVLEIYGDFVAQSGRFQVNLPHDDRLAIEKSVNELLGCADLSLSQQSRHIRACIAGLSQAQITIFNLMASDSLPRFLADRSDGMTIKSGTLGGIKSSNGGGSTQLPITIQNLRTVPSTTSA